MEERDDFWDIDMITPKKPQPRADVSPRATAVSFGNEASENRAAIPPRDASRHNAAVRALKEAEERASLRPLLEYCPEDSPIMRVRVFPWPSEYSFYERFLTDAEKYYRVKCDPLDFVPFFSYTPQYNQMNIEQLRYYIYWRYRLRHGEYIKTDYSYIFLYLYELINLENVSTPEARLDSMCRVWLAYRADFPRLDRYVGEWITDFCLIHRLPPPVDALDGVLGEVLAEMSLREFYLTGKNKHTDVSLYNFIRRNNTYRYERSSVYSAKTKALFDTHLFAAVVYAIEKTEHSSEEKRRYSKVTSVRPSYANALCVYSVKRRIEVEYLSYSHTYRFRGLITSFVKSSENGIRAALGMKTRLSAPGLSEEALLAVREYYDKHLPPASAAPAPKKSEEDIRYELYERRDDGFTPDSAVDIEEKSWELTKLLTDGIEDDTPDIIKEPPVIPEPVAEAEEAQYGDEYGLLVSRLDDIQRGYIRALLSGDGAEYIKNARVFEAALQDRINELAFDVTGDIIIDSGEISEDYRELIGKYFEE